MLQHRGTRVPQDMALIGFDDVVLASQAVPPLTTVHVTLYEQGQRTADLMLRLIDGDTAVPSDVWPLALVERATV